MHFALHLSMWLSHSERIPKKVNRIVFLVFKTQALFGSLVYWQLKTRC